MIALSKYLVNKTVNLLAYGKLSSYILQSNWSILESGNGVAFCFAKCLTIGAPRNCPQDIALQKYIFASGQNAYHHPCVLRTIVRRPAQHDCGEATIVHTNVSPNKKYRDQTSLQIILFLIQQDFGTIIIFFVNCLTFYIIKYVRQKVGHHLKVLLNKFLFCAKTK